MSAASFNGSASPLATRRKPAQQMPGQYQQQEQADQLPMMPGMPDATLNRAASLGQRTSAAGMTLPGQYSRDRAPAPEAPQTMPGMFRANGTANYSLIARQQNAAKLAGSAAAGSALQTVQSGNDYQRHAGNLDGLRKQYSVAGMNSMINKQNTAGWGTHTRYADPKFAKYQDANGNFKDTPEKRTSWLRSLATA